MLGRIYKITCLVNDKIYIGCTIKTLNSRFQEHKSRCKKDVNNKFYNSIKKYGIDNFTIELVEECEIEIMYEREKYYILKYDTYNTGLNSTVGGEGCLGYKHTEEVIEKMKNTVNHFKDKTYNEIYGDNYIEQIEKRKESVSKYWANLTPEDRIIRANKVAQGHYKNSKISIDKIKQIKKDINEGMSSKEYKLKYPDLSDNLFYDLRLNRKWKYI